MVGRRKLVMQLFSRDLVHPCVSARGLDRLAINVAIMQALGDSGDIGRE